MLDDAGHLRRGDLRGCRRSATHRQAAVDGDHRPGDVARPLVEQEQHGVGELGRVTAAAKGDQLADGLLRVGRHRVGHVRLEHAGNHGVDGDASAGDLAASERDRPNRPAFAAP